MATNDFSVIVNGEDVVFIGDFAAANRGGASLRKQGKKVVVRHTQPDDYEAHSLYQCAVDMETATAAFEAERNDPWAAIQEATTIMHDIFVDVPRRCVMATLPQGITLHTTAYKRGRQLIDEQVVSMTTFVPGREDIVVSFPEKTTLDDVYRIMGYRYTLTNGPVCDRNTTAGTVTVRRHYVLTDGGSGYGNGHQAGA